LSNVQSELPDKFDYKRSATEDYCAPQQLPNDQVVARPDRLSLRQCFLLKHVAPLPAPMDEALRPLSPRRPSRLAGHYVHDQTQELTIGNWQLPAVHHPNMYPGFFSGIRIPILTCLWSDASPLSLSRNLTRSTSVSLSCLTSSRYEEPAHVKPIDGFKGWFKLLYKNSWKCMLLISPRV
jgi:hypothetical protein